MSQLPGKQGGIRQPLVELRLGFGVINMSEHYNAALNLRAYIAGNGDFTLV
jgi:hypothetical protein